MQRNHNSAEAELPVEHDQYLLVGVLRFVDLRGVTDSDLYGSPAGVPAGTRGGHVHGVLRLREQLHLLALERDRCVILLQLLLHHVARGAQLTQELRRADALGGLNARAEQGGVASSSG